MSRVDLASLGHRATHLASMMTELGPETRAAFNVTRIEALALADLVEKAQALVNYHEGHYAALFDALAALFDKEGR